jgi:hypothetical protein
MALRLPIERLAASLTAFEASVAEANGRLLLTEYLSDRVARSFDSNLIPTELYQAIFTAEVVEAVTHYFHGREPFIFDSVFVYTHANALKLYLVH